MDWVTSIHQAIQYIEQHLREELTIREIAQQAALSPFYFQKGFAMLCGMTVGDYIRQRRLSAAGLEVLTTDRRIIDIALEFGYDSPDSFTKAFISSLTTTIPPGRSRMASPPAPSRPTPGRCFPAPAGCPRRSRD